MTKPLSITLKLLLTVVASLSFGSGVKADPLFFSNTTALQDDGFTSVDLFSNPNTMLIGPQISFIVDLNGNLQVGATDVLRITYTEANSAPIVQSYQIPLFGVYNPPLTLLFTLTSPNANAQGVAATLMVDLLSSNPDYLIPSGPNGGQLVNSYTYEFRVATPVPEPSTIALAGVGFSLLSARLRRRRLRKE